MNVVWMLHNGTTRDKAAKLANISLRTVQRIVDAFIEARLDGVRKWDVQGPVSDMAPFRDLIRKSLEDRPPRTVAEAGDRIFELTGLRRGPTQIRKFLKDLGFSWKRTRAVPVPPKKTSKSTPATRRSFSIAN
jgi:transposase